jgi:hypothetical protein
LKALLISRFLTYVASEADEPPPSVPAAQFSPTAVRTSRRLRPAVHRYSLIHPAKYIHLLHRAREDAPDASRTVTDAGNREYGRFHEFLTVNKLIPCCRLIEETRRHRGI